MTKGTLRTVLLPGRSEGSEVPLVVTVLERPRTQEAEKSVTLRGDPRYSSANQPDGKRTTVLLAHERVQAQYHLALPQGNHLVEITAKHGMAGPVKIILRVNGKRWKTVTFGKNNNAYERKAVGILSNFSQGTLSAQLVNDAFTCTKDQLRSGQTAGCDRNAQVDALTFTRVGP